MNENNDISRKQIKILLVSHEMTYTGAPRSLLQIAKLLIEEQYFCEVLTLKRGSFETEFENCGIPVKNIDFPDSASEKLGEELKKYDLILANTIFCSSFARYAQNYTKVILYLREAQNIPELIANCNLNKEDLYKIEHIVCVSEYAKNFIQERYHRKNVSVIHNYVEEVIPQRNYIKKKHKLNIIVSGTIEPRKGQDFIIEVYNNLPSEERENINLHIVGSQPSWAKEYQESLHLGNTEGIIYHGEIKNRNELLKLYQRMDIFLVPSKDEACSLVALEAAMLGKAILLSENIGAQYIVDKKYILKTGSSKEWENCIRDLVQQPDFIDQLGKENRARYKKYGTKTVYKKNFLGYLQQVIHSTPKIYKKNPIKVSIVVPVYNVENYLKQCLKSLAYQTLKNVEFICVNDGSTDDSLQILQDYKDKDTRFSIISTENRGYGHAMNVGISHASGEYIGIVEPDDYISPEMYEVLYHRALLSDADIIKCDFYRFYGDIEERNNIYNLLAQNLKNYNRIISPAKEKGCFRFMLNTWAGIYKREFIISNNINHNETPGASYQDNGFWFKGFCYAKNLYFVNKALYYNRRDNPCSSVNNRKKVYCINSEYEYIREFLHNNAKFEKEFIYQYSMKKYHAYLFNLKRIDWNYKKEYLKKFSEEFRTAKRKGELSQAVFTPPEWANIHWIIQDYEDYYNSNIMEEIQISVVVPVYNAEKYLEKCLSSLEKQYFQRMEIICIDDGSTDNSREIIYKFVNRDKRFQIYTQNNQGAGAARNRGMELSKGKYIIFLDADDYFSPNMLSDGFNKIRETEADICVMGSWQHDMRTDTITPCTYSLQLNNLPSFRPFRVDDMLQNPFRCFVGWAWDKLFLKKFLVNNGLKFQEQRTSNDMYFTYMALFKADKITTLDSKVIYQRRNISGSLSATRELSWECFYYALKAMKRELENMGMYEKRQINFQNYALHSCLWNLATLPEEAAFKLMKKIRSVWAHDLEIDKLDISKVEYPEEYADYKLILEENGLIEYRRKYQESKNKKAINRVNCHYMEFSSESDYLRYCLEEIRKSKSYKIGLALTWLPRKIRELKKGVN